MERPSGRIDTSTRAWRAREIARAVFSRGPGMGGGGILRGIVDVAVVLLFAYFCCLVAAPAAVLILAFAKEDFSGLGSRVMSDPAALLGGWGAVFGTGQEGIGYVAAVASALAIAASVAFAANVLVVQRSAARRNSLGMPKGLRRGEYGEGGVEDNQIVISQIFRTIDPRKAFEHAGLVLGYIRLLHRYIVSGPENHTSLIAKPGAGKTSRFIIQTVFLLIDALKDSAVIFDPKGEIYGLTGAYARERANVILWDYDNWKRSNLYNCLSQVTAIFRINWERYNDLVRRSANAMLAGDDEEARRLGKQAEMARIDAYTEADAMVGSIALSLIPETVKTDVYWTPSARRAFHAVAGAVATYTRDQWVGEGEPPFEPADEQRTLKTVAYLIDQSTKWNQKEGKIALTDFFDGLGPENPFSRRYAQIRNAEGANLSSLISSLNRYLVDTTSPANDMIGYGMPKGYENLERIGEEKTIVYIVVSTESADKKVMLPIITKQIYDALIRCTKRHGGVLPFWTHFVMEELGSMSLIGDFEEFLRTGRGYGIRMHAVLQSENQWVSMYGRDHARTIQDSINCTNYLSITNSEDAEALSREIGDCTIETSTESSRGGLLSGEVSVTSRRERVRAVPAHKIEEWDPSWGSFVRIDKLYANGILNRLLFHRHTARIAICPTASPKDLPGSCEMGVDTLEKSVALREAADREDLSSLRREIPPWDPFNTSEARDAAVKRSIAEENAVGFSTSMAIRKAYRDLADQERLSEGIERYIYECGAEAAREAASAIGEGTGEAWSKKAYAAADKRRKDQISRANRLCAAMIAAVPFEVPEQDSAGYESYLLLRRRMQGIWKKGLKETLGSMARGKEGREDAEEEEAA